MTTIDPAPQLDRLAPRQRPAGKPQGYQRWRMLLFLHWEVPVEILRPLVPSRLELDLFEGRAYVGLVPFAMQGVRMRGCPELLSYSFLETNVRTYVYQADGPGVYFFSLDAASSPAVAVARRRWHLPYYLADMSLEGDSQLVRYQVQRRGGHPQLDVRYRPGRERSPAAPGTLDFFLIERYLLYCEARGQLYCGQVHHAPYPLQDARVMYLRDELVSAAGFSPLKRDPDYVHYSPGVDVEIFPLRPVAGQKVGA